MPYPNDENRNCNIDYDRHDDDDGSSMMHRQLRPRCPASLRSSPTSTSSGWTPTRRYRPRHPQHWKHRTSNDEVFENPDDNAIHSLVHEEMTAGSAQDHDGDDRIAAQQIIAMRLELWVNRHNLTNKTTNNNNNNTDDRSNPKPDNPSDSDSNSRCATVIPFGSYRLETHLPESDLDLLILAGHGEAASEAATAAASDDQQQQQREDPPPLPDTAAFFQTLQDEILGTGEECEFDQFHALPWAHVPVLKCRFRKRLSVDILYGALPPHHKRLHEYTIRQRQKKRIQQAPEDCFVLPAMIPILPKTPYGFKKNSNMVHASVAAASSTPERTQSRKLAPSPPPLRLRHQHHHQQHHHHNSTTILGASSLQVDEDLSMHSDYSHEFGLGPDLYLLDQLSTGVASRLVRTTPPPQQQYQGFRNTAVSPLRMSPPPLIDGPILPPSFTPRNTPTQAPHQNQDYYVITDADYTSRDADDSYVRSLNGARVTQVLADLNRGDARFPVVVRLIKLWATAHHIYGFWNGIHWSILVTYILQQVPANMSVVDTLHLFMDTFGKWPYPKPIALTLPANRAPLDTSHLNLQGQVCPILTPCHPCMNAAFGVGPTQLRRIQFALRFQANTLQRHLLKSEISSDYLSISHNSIIFNNCNNNSNHNNNRRAVPKKQQPKSTDAGATNPTTGTSTTTTPSRSGGNIPWRKIWLKSYDWRIRTPTVVQLVVRGPPGEVAWFRYVATLYSKLPNQLESYWNTHPNNNNNDKSSGPNPIRVIPYATAYTRVVQGMRGDCQEVHYYMGVQQSASFELTDVPGQQGRPVYSLDLRGAAFEFHNRVAKWKQTLQKQQKKSPEREPSDADYDRCQIGLALISVEQIPPFVVDHGSWSSPPESSPAENTRPTSAPPFVGQPRLQPQQQPNPSDGFRRQFRSRGSRRSGGGRSGGASHRSMGRSPTSSWEVYSPPPPTLVTVPSGQAMVLPIPVGLTQRTMPPDETGTTYIGDNSGVSHPRQQSLNHQYLSDPQDHHRCADSQDHFQGEQRILPSPHLINNLHPESSSHTALHNQQIHHPCAIPIPQLQCIFQHQPGDQRRQSPVHYVQHHGDGSLCSNNSAIQMTREMDSGLPFAPQNSHPYQGEGAESHVVIQPSYLASNVSQWVYTPDGGAVHTQYILGPVPAPGVVQSPQHHHSGVYQHPQLQQSFQVLQPQSAPDNTGYAATSFQNTEGFRMTATSAFASRQYPEGIPGGQEEHYRHQTATTAPSIEERLSDPQSENDTMSLVDQFQSL